MAIFVVVAGVLLMLGGATALLFGFDIVMTERGSAMVIGGTVTLSGGAITVGIGFALVKLNQILRTLALRDGKMLRATPPTDRPVVPMIASETALSAQSLSPQSPEPSLAGMPVTRMPVTGMAATDMAVGGLAVAGLAVAGAAAAGYSMVPKTNVDEPNLDGTGLSEQDVVAFADVTPAENTEIEANTAPQNPMSSLDLEAELSRALNETGYSNEKDRRFTAGLSEHLSKSGGVTPSPLSVSLPQESSSKEDTASGGTAISDPLVLSFVQPHSDTRADDDNIVEGAEDEPIVSIEGTDLDGDPTDVVDIDTAHGPGVAPPLDGERPEVLRTYNAGGRSYTIYVDGSVEAETKNGVERFVSMEEFRHHLTNA